MCGGFGDWKEQDEALPPKAWGDASSLHFHVCPKANRTHTDMAFEAIGDKTRQDMVHNTSQRTFESVAYCHHNPQGSNHEATYSATDTLTFIKISTNLANGLTIQPHLSARCLFKSISRDRNLIQTMPQVKRYFWTILYNLAPTLIKYLCSHIYVNKIDYFNIPNFYISFNN